MKRTQINTIFAADVHRKRQIFKYICVIAMFAIIASVILFVYLKVNKVKFVNYTEDSSVDYKVYLKENKFYDDDYLEQDNQYISNLVDYISANFHYKLSLEKENVSYKYIYKIVAKVVVKDTTTNKDLYNYDEELLSKVEQTTTNSSVTIEENLEIDYNKYNDLIKEFINTYDIDKAQSNVYINLYVDVIGSCEDFEKDSNNESVTSLVIPLTNNTLDLNITNNILENSDNIIVCDKPSKLYSILLIVSVCFYAYVIFRIIMLVNYINKTRSAKSIYHRELKKILSNYHSYIQKVDSSFDMDEYKLLPIETFADMLEIRDTINQPILMIDDMDNAATHFVIPGNNNILYIYSLSIPNIQKEIRKQK